MIFAEELHKLVVGEVFDAGLGLEKEADGFEQGGLDAVFEGGVIFDLVDGAHAQVAGGDGFAQGFGQARDRDVEGATGLLEDAECV